MMAFSASGGGGTISTPSYKTKGEKLAKAIVIEDIKIVEKEIPVEIPKIVERVQEQIKYVTKEETQIKYIPKEEITIKFVPKEESTVKYNVKEEETVKFVPKEIQIERPVLVPKEYERPIVKEKIVDLVTYSDVNSIKELIEIVPQLKKDIKDILVQLGELRKYKLVEQEIKVPKITWVSTPVERVVWKDIERERPKDADQS
jgi:hypothetical protein